MCEHAVEPFGTVKCYLQLILKTIFVKGTGSLGPLKLDLAEVAHQALLLTLSLAAGHRESSPRVSHEFLL